MRPLKKSRKKEVEAFDKDPANREQISSNKMFSGENRRLNYGYKYLETVFDSLGISEFGASLQQHLDSRIKSLIGRDLKYAFYDETNYFFEIDFPDEDGELRKRGVSKEHRVDPIVQMGFFIDGNGLLVSMSLFLGNTSDTLTLQPVMADVKKAYGMQRLIVVADKGMNSTKNIDYICQNGDGYVVSQVLRGPKGKRYLEQRLPWPRKNAMKS